MGSPQPPQVMPQPVKTTTTVAASSFNRLPLDVKYIILQKLDSFATLDTLEIAFKAETEEILGLFRRGIHSAIAQTEFAPVADAVMAIRMLDSAASANAKTGTVGDKIPNSVTIPHLVEELNTPVETGSGLLDAPEIYNKLYTLNIAAIGLAELYGGYKDVVLSTVEFHRFKQAVFRCATFFELYKEAKAFKLADPAQGDDGEEEDEEDEHDEENDTDEGKEKTKYRPRNTFLASIPHQEVLEMDCVREFMHEIAEGIAKLVEEDDEENEVDVCQDQLASVLSEFGFGMPAMTKASCTCSSRNDFINESNDHNDGINNDNDNTACTLQTPHLADSLLLLGPIALLRLYAISLAQPQRTQLLKAIIHTLVPAPNKKRDIFWDEVMPFWKGLSGVYDLRGDENAETKKAKEKKLPKGCTSIMDVMGIKRYEYAVLDSGRLFY